MAKYQNYKQKSKARPVSETKGKAQQGPETIKKKSLYISKSAWITIAVLVVIAALIVVWIGATHGWFPEKNEAIGGEYKVESYDPLEIDRTVTEVTDETVDAQINSILSQHAEPETITTGQVENGDTVNIDYVGTDALTGEAFEGGTAEKQNLKIGSGTFIEGFESGLIGKDIGSQVVLDLTFPEDYGKAELAGKAVKFAVTINSASRDKLPELTDAFAKEYAEEHITDAEEPVETVDALKAYVKKNLADSYLESAIVSAMDEKVTVTTYDEEKLELIKPYIQQSLESTATSYGMDLEQMAQAFGAEDSDSYIQQQAEDTLKQIIWVDQVIKDQKISWTGVQYDKALEEYMQQSGQTSQTLKEFKKQADPALLYVFKNLDFKYQKVLDVLKTKVKLVEPKEETEEETAAEPESETAAEPETTPAP